MTQKRTLEDTLNHYFSSIRDSKGLSYPADKWQISYAEINRLELYKYIDYWFLIGPYAPKLHQGSCFLDTSTDFLSTILQRCYIYKLYLTPPIYYACVWDEFILYKDNDCYSLFFGLND